MPSYSPVFSQPLIQYSADTPNTSFEVPSGFTAVIRQISILISAGSVTGGVYIADSESAAPVWIAYVNEYGVLQAYQQEGRWVVPEGGFIFLEVSSLIDTASAYVGGYLLRNTLS